MAKHTDASTVTQRYVQQGDIRLPIQGSPHSDPQTKVIGMEEAFDKGAGAALKRIKWQMLRVFFSKDLPRGIKAFKQRTTAELKGN